MKIIRLKPGERITVGYECSGGHAFLLTTSLESLELAGVFDPDPNIIYIRNDAPYYSTLFHELLHLVFTLFFKRLPRICDFLNYRILDKTPKEQQRIAFLKE